MSIASSNPLQDTMDKIQKYRDTALSKKNIAEQRLKIAKEDYDAILKSIAAVEEQINSFPTEEDKQEMMETLEKDIETISNEYLFSHEELVQKRNKMQGALKLLQDDAKKRSHHKHNHEKFVNHIRTAVEKRRADRTITLPDVPKDALVNEIVDVRAILSKHILKALDYKLELIKYAKMEADETIAQNKHLIQCYAKNAPGDDSAKV